MWTEDFDEDSILEGNVVDIQMADSKRINSEIVKVHCFVCGEQFVGSKDQAGIFLFGHKKYHLWVIELDDIMGGA
jgi:hypothetical protein|tara:strand:- start:1414 stop:1638 length:225 start_codon:yes stop_codon:yes gene_type:complete